MLFPGLNVAKAILFISQFRQLKLTVMWYFWATGWSQHLLIFLNHFLTVSFHYFPLSFYICNSRLLQLTESDEVTISLISHHYSELNRENLTFIFKCLEFQCISAGIEEEHGGLLAGFTFEADVGFDDEIHPCFLQFFG